MKNPPLKLTILCSFLIQFWLHAPASAQADRQPKSTISYEALFQALTDTISQHFYNTAFIENTFPKLTETYRKKLSTADDQEEFKAVVDAYLAEFHTSHTNYFTPDDAAYYYLSALFEYRQVVKEAFSGEQIEYPTIGLLTEKDGETIRVLGALDGGAARLAGVRKGDIIRKLAGLPYSMAVLRENVGKAVRLEVLRNGEPLSFEVTPTLLHPQREMEAAVRAGARLIEHNGKKLAYIHFWSFAGEQYYEILKDAVLYGELKDADALILDLREGWGGASPEYLNIFNRRVPQIGFSSRSGEVSIYDSQWRKPAVLLINERVRSGKELLAYGFRKYELGKVIGTPTAGAVTAGRIFYLPDNSLLYLAVSMATVDGEILEGSGVQPDILVEDDLSTEADEQLQRAVEWLGKQ